MSRRLLYITHHQLNQNNGGANASKGFLHCLASLFDEGTVMCHNMKDAKSFIPQHLVYMPLIDHRSKVRKLVDMYRGIINGYYYFVREHLKDQHYDVVVIDHTFSGAGLAAFIKDTGAKLITIHHNVERDYLRDNSKEKPLLYRWPFLHYSIKAEKESLQYSNVCLTVTKHDAQVFRSWDINSHIHHWGIFAYQPIADKVFKQKPIGYTFIITGSLYFEQSLRPIIAFIRHYWPLVRQHCPQATLIIAGRNPSVALQEVCAGTTGITIIANPANMESVVSKADYYLCPINTGSGLKLRLFDGLKQGLPVLCHDVAANGYEALAEKGCLFTYHDEPSFMTALDSMLSTTVIPANVFGTYQDVFSPETGINRLHSILQKENIIT